MAPLRRTLEHITIILIASGCGGSSHKVRPTGGGCEGMLEPAQMEVVMTEAIRAELDACAAKPDCQPVCKLALQQTVDVGGCRVDPPTEDGKLVVHYTTQASCPGRRPATAARTVHAIETIGELLARQAELEAMSVGAFEDLAKALTAHDAPHALVRAARRSARDEVRHAAACARLAARFGATPARFKHVSAATPSLPALALDNAVEGEVRETWGAAVATWQAHVAHDPAVRRAMRGIAVDETRHATLAMKIGAWARTQLDERSRRRVTRARRDAIAELASATRANPPAAAVRELGVPDAATAVQLFAALDARVWS